MIEKNPTENFTLPPLRWCTTFLFCCRHSSSDGSKLTQPDGRFDALIEIHNKIRLRDKGRVCKNYKRASGCVRIGREEKAIGLASQNLSRPKPCSRALRPYFERAGFNIAEAKVHTTRNGYALDTFKAGELLLHDLPSPFEQPVEGNQLVGGFAGLLDAT